MSGIVTFLSVFVTFFLRSLGTALIAKNISGLVEPALSAHNSDRSTYHAGCRYEYRPVTSIELTADELKTSKKNIFKSRKTFHNGRYREY